MAYIDLSDADKDAVQALASLCRQFAGELGRLLQRCENVAAYYSGNVESILAGLAGSDVIPNTTGYAGAQDLTRDQLVTLVGYLMAASAATGDGSYNTAYHRSLYARSCGPANLVI